MASPSEQQMQRGTNPRKARRWPPRPPGIDAREGGDSTWELWQEASRRLDLAFAPTEPSGLAPLSTDGAPETLEVSTRSHLLNAQSLMVLARRNNRVCPRPALWSQLYGLLEGERQADLQAPPVQPWLWPKLSGLQKRLRFREHVEWA
jgi:hypothetical protein